MPTTPPNDATALILAAILAPRGVYARLCEACGEPEAARRALFRALVLLLAGARGLLAGAPAAFQPGGPLDSAGEPELEAHALAALGDLAAPGDLAALPVRALGSLAEELAGRRLTVAGGRVTLAGGGAARGAAGAYYTPQPIIDELIEAALARRAREWLAEGRDLLDLRVCDPAMGSGHFLVAAAHRLADLLAAQRPGADRAALLRLAAERCLFGVDLDPLAAELARLSLWLECSRPGAELRLDPGRLRVGESLLGVAWEREPGFDVLLGNPPWGRAAPAERRALRERYRCVRGEPERAALFLELALRICRPGGRIGLVTPNTWLTLVRMASLRRLLLDSARVELLSEHPAGSFPAARSIVPLALVAQIAPPGDAALVRRAGAERRASQGAWRSAPECVIDLRIDDAARAALARIDACSTPLDSVARVSYGIKTGDNQASLCDAPRDARDVPALTGAGEVRRHTIRWGGRFLRYGPQLAGYRREPVDRPKIVVQYIRNLALPQRIVAAVDEAGGYYPLNNFSFITAHAPYDPFFLCALLCSRLLSRVFAARYHDYNIKPAYLRQLPIRRIAFHTPPAERAALADQALALPPHLLAGAVDALLGSRPERADAVHDILAALGRRAAGGDGPADELIDAVAARLYGVDADALPPAAG